MDFDSQALIFPQGNFMRIQNGLVEEASCQDNANGFLVVSHSVQEGNRPPSVQTIRLNISRNTILLNTSGQSMCACCLQAGMRISAIISSRITRSIPPQASAFLILVLPQMQPPVQPSPLMTTGIISAIDFGGRTFVTQNLNSWNQQTRFVTTDDTVITNRFGSPIPFDSLRPDQIVQVTHADFQTTGIPPQTTAFRVQVL